MPSELQVTVGPLRFLWLLCLVHLACGATGVSQIDACQPRYVSPSTHRTKVLLLGCDESINKLTLNQLEAAGSFLDRLIASNSLDESSIAPLNGLLRGGREGPVINIAVAQGGQWTTLYPSARIGILEISGEHSSALLVGDREVLLSLDLGERTNLAEALDALIQKHQWELFNQETDPVWRSQFVAELIRSLHSRMIGTSAIDVYVVSGRLSEPL